MIKQLVLAAVVLCSLPVPAFAQAPAPLRAWEDWAAAPFAYRECAIKPGQDGTSEKQYACQWPGELRLSVSATNGEFSQSWQMDRKGAVVVPGSRELWPQEVRVNGTLVPVVDQGGLPVVRLQPGKHAITGRWSWDQPPSSVDIPPQTAWWTVSRPGEGGVRREANALLLEDQASVPASSRNTLNLRVFRKWTDAQVPQQDVRLQFNAGGAPREVVLGPVVDPTQWQPLRVQSAWPVQWQADGKLRVQVQPGSNDLVLSLRCTQKCTGPFLRPAAVDPWPQMEYWALQGDPPFRVVAWEGQSIDPKQVAAPPEWVSLPWINVSALQSGKWTVKSRGPADKDAPLTLSRAAWLDFDGRDWWVLDRVAGPAPRSGRLNALPPYKMAAATQNEQPLLVSEDKGTTGVELRAEHLDAQVLLRQPERAPVLPVAGVEGQFSQVNWILHMPAGYQVLFAPGADEADQVWWNRWRLTQVLSVALLLVLSWRWAGWKALAPAALLILLSFHTPGLPRWSWGAVLALGLLAHAGLPDRLRRVFLWAWRAMLVLWVLLAASFAVHQVQAAMYPDWVMDDGRAFSHYAAATMEEASMADERMRNASARKAPQGPASSMEQHVYTDAAQAAAGMEKDMMGREAMPVAAPMPVAPPPPPAAQVIKETGTRISAGPGRPSWQARQPVQLSWQGPITQGDTVRLWIVGPFLVGLGRWASVLLLMLVGWSLWKPASPWLGLRWPRRTAPVALLALLALPAWAQSAPTADLPSPPSAAWMDRLGQEKHPIPECAPSCVSIPWARLSVVDGDLVIDLEAHAQAHAALALPVDADQALTLRRIQLAGNPVASVLMEDGQHLLPLPKGVSTLRLVFAARASSGTMNFPLVPGRIQVDDKQWSFSGIDRQRLSSGVLGWQRVSPAATPRGKPEESEVAVAPFVQITRTLVMGPKWEVHTQVARLAPDTGAFVSHVSLLPGEQPRQDLPRDEDGNMVVSFQAGQQVVSWTSDLPAKTRLELVAPQPEHAIERWVIQPSQRFHVQASGLPSRADAPLSFQPLPGEKLVLEISEPKALAGQVVAVDSVSMSQQWGPRGQAVDLVLTTRATTTTDLTLTVPNGLELVHVLRNGSPLAGARIENNQLLLSVLPGLQQWNVSFRNGVSPSMKVGSPQFSIDAPLANLTLSHAPGEKRWVLGTPGPGKSPAVAYWPWLVVLLAAAWLVGQWKHSPLKTWQWVLLGLGFSVAAPWKVALVGAWLVALHQRQLHSDRLHANPAFNLVQAGLVMLTLLALATIVGALPQSLLASPDMKIYGASGGTFSWFVDQVEMGQAWPQAFVISAPMWLYRALMLAWSLWLAISAINWLRDGLRAWLSGGHWHSKPPKPPAPPQAS